MDCCQTDISDPRLQDDLDVNDATFARKIQKSDREKLRRDKLNEHFQDLGNVLDSDRRKNDKATIVIDAIQALKDLTSEVSRLRSEHVALYRESNELTLENKELREDKTSLLSDVSALEVQYQQTLSCMFPWAPVDRTVVTTLPFSYSLAQPVPPCAFRMCAPPLQPMQFFGNQYGDPGSTFISYLAPQVDQPSISSAPSSYISSQEVENASYVQNRTDDDEIDDPNDVVTDLELKLPGSASQKGTRGSSR